MSEKPYKLMHFTFANGGAITLHPSSIQFAMPNPKNLMHSIVGYGGGLNAEIGTPYNAFIKKWQAALEGKDLIEGMN